MKITEQQVKDCYENKELLKELFPEVFKVKHEIGKWYCGENGQIAFYEKKAENFFSSNGYGIDNIGNWCENISWTFVKSPKYWRLATREEVEKALIAEAEKRGLLELGVKLKSAWSGIIDKNKRINLVYDYEVNNLMSDYDSPTKTSVSLFYQGKWAEIIQETEIELTLDQIAEKFGVDKVKIKKD